MTVLIRVIDELDHALRALADSGREFTKVPVVYVAHPLGGDVPNNHANALIWMRFLLRKWPWVAFVAPWLVDSMVLDDANPAEREAAMARCREAVTRCDAIILVGGRVSSGMTDELEVANHDGLWVFDATPIGFKAPLEELAPKKKRGAA